MENTTKKLLVAFDPIDPNSGSSDFLVPVLENGEPKLLGLISKRIVDYGLVVYVGNKVKAEDIFARLVDSGTVVRNVKETFKQIEIYLSQIKNHKIGSVIEIVPDQNNENSFTLQKSSLKVPKKLSKLP